MTLGEEINKALENVDQVTYGTRLGICKGSTSGVPCPAYKAGVCSDCLCIMAVKAKLKSQACPRGKWK